MKEVTDKEFELLVKCLAALLLTNPEGMAIEAAKTMDQDEWNELMRKADLLKDGE